MAQLPDDVWRIVIENLPNYQLDDDGEEYYIHDVDDLRSLRLTCRTLTPLAGIYIFGSLNLRPNARSINRASQISQHADLRDYLVELALRPETSSRTRTPQGKTSRET
jgi:hypothetical protein